MTPKPTYAIYIGYDPCGISWLGQDPDLTMAERATAFEKIENGEWEIYEVSLIKNCPEHGWKCQHTEELSVEGYNFAEDGHHGVYENPADIREESLRSLAYGMWAGVQA